MRDIGDLVRLYTTLRSGASAQHGRWRDLANIYDGGLVIPMPEFDEIEQSVVPGMVTTGVDGYARRFAGVLPAVQSPAMRSNVASSRKRAEERARIVRGWWQASQMSLALYQRGRYFFGYGAMPAVIRSRPGQPGVPDWEALNPMGVLCGPKAKDYSPEVPYAFMSGYKSLGWLKDNYGVDFGTGNDAKRERLVEVIEYNDAEQVTVFCLTPSISVNPRYTDGHHPFGFAFGGWGGFPGAMRYEKGKGGWCVPLSSTPNLSGVCEVSHPGAISLSRVGGLVDNILGMHKLQARMMALITRKMHKDVWPEMWVVSDGSGQTPTIVTEANGLSGKIGLIENGKIDTVQTQANFQALQVVDLLERNQRVTAGIVPQMGGENPTNVRTGRASDTVSGAAVDPILAEAHEIAQEALEHENRIAVARAKGHGGSRPVSMYVAGKTSAKERVEYTPSEVFETDETTVRYSLVGADAQGLIIAAAQSIGTEMMSKQRARVLNPFVEDPDGEAIRIRTEAAEGMAQGMALEMAAGSPEDMAFFLKQTAAGVPLGEIIDAMQRRVQERQANVAAQGEPTGPVAPGSPEAQPGLGDPAVAAAPTEAVGEVPQSMSNVASLFTAARRPAMTTPAERVG